jgi:hypothetical protein
MEELFSCRHVRPFKIFPHCQLVPPHNSINITLNMLCPCCQNPLLLAHKALKGLFSFKATPMAPLGTEVLVHMKQYCQHMWGYHASKAWYLLHAAKHYRCIRVLMADTGSKKITDMFQFKHHAIPVLVIAATDRIIDAMTRLTATIAGIQDAPQINKLLNKLSQFLLCTKWIDESLFDCRGLHHSKVATGRRKHLPGGRVPPFGNTPARRMPG